MANEEHLAKLMEGVEAWNAWAVENLVIHPELSGEHRPDLSGANLEGANLQGVNFEGVNLIGANLEGANLQGANIILCYLAHANLMNANLRSANLRSSNLDHANLIRANFHHHLKDRSANLMGVSLHHSNLSEANLLLANLTGAKLKDTNLTRAILVRSVLDQINLKDAILTEAEFGSTLIGNVDLSSVKDLDTIRHRGPSTVGTDTLFASRGRIDEAFLRGCGLSDWEIEAAKLWDPDLTEDERTDIFHEISRIQGDQPIQINPLFISYTRTDSPFVDAIKTKLTKDGIRFWTYGDDMKAGRLEKQIDRAIRLNPTVLLVLSKDSVESDWVAWEAEKARELEKELKRDVLCPVTLDEAWKTCDWEGPLRSQIKRYNILDFSDWKNKAAMDQQYRKLVEGIHLFYERGKANST